MAAPLFSSGHKQRFFSFFAARILLARPQQVKSEKNNLTIIHFIQMYV